MRDADCVAFLQWALPRMSMRWLGFRKVRRQVCKRIGRRIKELNLETLDQYRDHLKMDEDEWRVLDAACRITISRFYRDRHVFNVLASEVLPPIFTTADKQKRLVRCWCAGCASGEEPYTLAILYHNLLCPIFPDINFEVIATDADPVMIARAGKASYAPGSMRDLPSKWRDQAFVQLNGHLCLKEEYRECVTILLQDIRDEMPEGPFDVVLCRNLILTYFDAETQYELLKRVMARLRLGGYLVVGAHESLPEGFNRLEALEDCPSILRLAMR